jgi:hypothetical protein
MIQNDSAPFVPRRGSSTIHLMSRHREIIRLTILGWSTLRIAASVGLSVSTVRAILRAPLVQAELERLQDEADRMTVNVPLRSQVEGELRGATVQALRLNRKLMTDPNVDARTRSNVAKHFMDRVLFDVDSDTGERGTGYREILKRLDEVDKALGRGVHMIVTETPPASEAGTEINAVNGNEKSHDAPDVIPEHLRARSGDDLTEAIKSRISGIQVS